jgi:hypothetical protein
MTSALFRNVGVARAMAMLRLGCRIRLSPEGSHVSQLKACARGLVACGCQVLVFSFHSPSVVPGLTPYVRDRQDLVTFLGRIGGFLRFFREELGGRFVSVDDLL